MVDGLVADGTLAPAAVVQAEVVQDAGPAVHVAALGHLACKTHVKLWRLLPNWGHLHKLLVQ